MAGDGDRGRGQIRAAAVVIITTMLLWMAASFLGGRLGLPVRYAFLFDLAALAAFIWAFVVLATVWRKRRQDGE